MQDDFLKHITAVYQNILRVKYRPGAAPHFPWPDHGKCLGFGNEHLRPTKSSIIILNRYFPSFDNWCWRKQLSEQGRAYFFLL